MSDNNLMIETNDVSNDAKIAPRYKLFSESNPNLVKKNQEKNQKNKDVKIIFNVFIFFIDLNIFY